MTEVSVLGDPDPADADDPGYQEASVTVEEVVWKSTTQANVLAKAGKTTMVAHEAVWAGLLEAVEADATVVIVVGTRRPDESYPARFAIDVSSPQLSFLGPEPYAERDTQMLRAFISSEWNPMPSASALDLLIAWNDQVDRSPDSSEISIAWTEFVDNEVLGPSYPHRGTSGWWDAAPPECRNVADAPDSVLRDLTLGSVWIHVPPAWQALSDGFPCLWTDLGSLGCSVWSPTPRFDYLWFDEVYVANGSSVTVEVNQALEKDAISWVRRVHLATISWDIFAKTGIAVVELSTDAPGSYAELENEPARYAAVTIRSMSPDDARALIEAAPKATPVAGCPGPGCDG